MHGYGIVCVRYRETRAHRLAWELANGAIPSGQCVLHKCDNPPCCNPGHLFLGTKGDNAMDKARKVRTGVSKLTPASVLAIRDAYHSGVTQHAIAERFGIHQTQVSNVITRTSWAWL